MKIQPTRSFLPSSENVGPSAAKSAPAPQMPVDSLGAPRALPADELAEARSALQEKALNSAGAEADLARAALDLPGADSLAQTAVYTAALGALSAGLTGPVGLGLATAGIQAMEKISSPVARAWAGRPFLEALRQQPFDDRAAGKAHNAVSITSPVSSGAASAYLAALRSIALEDAPSRPGVGFDLAGRDMTTDPTADFYQHANGGWIANNPIPGDSPRYSRFTELRNASTRIQQEILEEASADADLEQGSDWQKLGDFYRSAMDTETIEAAGLSPIQPQLDGIAAIESRQDLQAEIAQLHKDGLGGFFSFGSTADAKDSTQMIAGAYQGGLGLPSRDYYLGQDEKSVEIRQAYTEHLQRMFGLLGQDAAQAGTSAQAVMGIETRLAEASLSRAEMRDPEAIYHMMSRDELGELTPHFDWNGYLDGRGLDEVQSLNMATPRFFEELDGVLTETPLDDLKAYMSWNLINTMASALPARFDEADFDFYGRVLNGTEEREPRSKRMAQTTSGVLGMALGREYVERAFPPEAKARAEEMIENIRGAIRDHITSLAWMGDETRARALEKLEAVAVKVGYPEEWPDYSDFVVQRGVHGENILGARAFGEAQDIAKIGQPRDRGEWHMSPADVNAYYSPSGNEIVFPAAILQPPFFNAEADDALNYGGIGMVIGHEFTHGFDDKGSQFDADGNLDNWWTEADRAEFETRADVIKQQANAFEVQPGLHLNGDLVLGESLADLGGATLALTALQKSLEGSENTEKLDGFTPEQRFFLGLAQVWAGNARPEYVRKQVQTDPHPVAPFRVNQTAKNVPAFAAAFEVESGDAMNLPEQERAQLW